MSGKTQSEVNLVQILQSGTSSQQLEPILIEGFKVTAKSQTCKCVVTATSTFDGAINVIIIHKCKDHDVMAAALSLSARMRTMEIIQQWKNIDHASYKEKV